MNKATQVTNAAIGLVGVTRDEVAKRVREHAGSEALEFIAGRLDRVADVLEGEGRLIGLSNADEVRSWSRQLRALKTQDEIVSWTWALVECLKGWDDIAQSETKQS